MHLSHLEAQLIHSLASALAVEQQRKVRVVLVPYDLAASEAADGDNHGARLLAATKRMRIGQHNELQLQELTAQG